MFINDVFKKNNKQFQSLQNRKQEGFGTGKQASVREAVQVMFSCLEALMILLDM